MELQHPHAKINIQASYYKKNGTPGTQLSQVILVHPWSKLIVLTSQKSEILFILNLYSLFCNVQCSFVWVVSCNSIVCVHASAIIMYWESEAQLQVIGLRPCSWEEVIVKESYDSEYKCTALKYCVCPCKCYVHSCKLADLAAEKRSACQVTLIWRGRPSFWPLNPHSLVQILYWH